MKKMKQLHENSDVDNDLLNNYVMCNCWVGNGLDNYQLIIFINCFIDFRTQEKIDGIKQTLHKSLFLFIWKSNYLIFRNRQNFLEKLNQKKLFQTLFPLSFLRLC